MPENADPMSALREALDEAIARPVRSSPEDNTVDWIELSLPTAQRLRAALRASIPPERDVETPDGTFEFVAFAVEYLALTLGEDNPTIKAGRRILETLAAAPSLEGARHPEDHPHDGYAYSGCECICCTNVRALQTPGHPDLRAAIIRAKQYVLGLPAAKCSEPIHIPSFEALEAIGFIEAVLEGARHPELQGADDD